MSSICGFKKGNLVMMALPFLMVFVGSSMAAGRENLQGQAELWSREDMVQMAGYGEEKLSTVLITGTILCHTCLDQEAHIPISGASVAVTCHAKRKKESTLAGVTDENGDFIIDLPSELHAIPSLEKRCYVEVLRLPKNPLCQPAFNRKQRGISLSSVGSSIRTYTARRISFMDSASKPLPACLKKKMDGKEDMSW